MTMGMMTTGMMTMGTKELDEGKEEAVKEEVKEEEVKEEEVKDEEGKEEVKEDEVKEEEVKEDSGLLELRVLRVLKHKCADLPLPHGPLRPLTCADTDARVLDESDESTLHEAMCGFVHGRIAAETIRDVLFVLSTSNSSTSVCLAEWVRVIEAAYKQVVDGGYVDADRPSGLVVFWSLSGWLHRVYFSGAANILANASSDDVQLFRRLLKTLRQDYEMGMAIHCMATNIEYWITTCCTKFCSGLNV